MPPVLSTLRYDVEVKVRAPICQSSAGERELWSHKGSAMSRKVSATYEPQGFGYEPHLLLLLSWGGVCRLGFD